jgi:hypothetical protein
MDRLGRAVNPLDYPALVVEEADVGGTSSMPWIASTVTPSPGAVGQWPADRSWASIWMPARPGLMVVEVSDMGAKIEQAMRRAEKVQAKQLRADAAEIEADARAAGGDQA